VTNDPVRLAILAAHTLIEELIELVIAEAVPNSECFNVPRMEFWRKLKIIRALQPPPENNKVWEFIQKLTELRKAAAHKDYQKERAHRFAELAKLFPTEPPLATARDRERFLEESTEICAGVLMGMLGLKSLFPAIASKISSRVSLANALEILSILALSIKCLVTVRRPERASVVAKT
jgi:hypothetical protein